LLSGSENFWNDPGEALAVIALKAREPILDRNRALINANLKPVGEFFTDFSDLFEWEAMREWLVKRTG